MTGPLHDIRYVRVGTDDLDGCVDFATRILGLELVRREAGCAYLRGDDRDHNICYVKGSASGHVTGFEVTDSAQLDALTTALEQQGIAAQHGSADACEQRRVRELATFRDPTGNVIDLVVRPAASGTRCFLSRDAGITEFSHVGLRSVDSVRDEAFWTGHLGAKVSDRIGDAPLLRIDEVHHKVALFQSAFPGIQHINFQVQGIDDIMRSWYFLRDQGVRIAFGPGRHPTSGARFLYFYGPDDMIYEYSTGVRRFTPEEDAVHVPRQFPREARSFCMWGSRPDIAEFRDAPAQQEVSSVAV